MIIKSQRLKKAISTALADDEMIKILDSVGNQAKSVRDIISEKDIHYTKLQSQNKNSRKVFLAGIETISKN